MELVLLHGAPLFRMRDGRGKFRATIQIDEPSGEASFLVWDENGVRASLSQDALKLKDGKSKVLWRTPK